jgi:hypothetical protein
MKAVFSAELAKFKMPRLLMFFRSNGFCFLSITSAAAQNTLIVDFDAYEDSLPPCKS